MVVYKQKVHMCNKTIMNSARRRRKTGTYSLKKLNITGPQAQK